MKGKRRWTLLAVPLLVSASFLLFQTEPVPKLTPTEATDSETARLADWPQGSPPDPVHSERTQVVLGQGDRKLVIVSETGSPVPKARAILCARASRSICNAVPLAESGQDGVMLIPYISDEELKNRQDLLVACYGYASTLVGPGDKIIVLTRRNVVRGIAHDDQGVPVANVTVTMSRGQLLSVPHEETTAVDSGATDDAIVSARTGEDGTFELGGLSSGRHSIRINHASYGVRRCSALDATPLNVPCPFVEITMTPILECSVQFMNDAALQIAYTYPDALVTSGVAAASVRWLRPRMTNAIDTPTNHLYFYSIPREMGGKIPEEVHFSLYAWLRSDGPQRIPLVMRLPAVAAQTQYISRNNQSQGLVRLHVCDLDGFVLPLKATVRTISGITRRIPAEGNVDPGALKWGKQLLPMREYELPAGKYEAEISDPNFGPICNTVCFEVREGVLSTVDMTIPIRACKLKFRGGALVVHVTLVDKNPRQGAPRYLGFFTVGDGGSVVEVAVPQADYVLTVSAAGYESLETKLDCGDKSVMEYQLPTLRLLR